MDANNNFITYYDKLVESCYISKQVNSVWQKAVASGEKLPTVKRNMSANIFRESCLTATPEQQGDEVIHVNSLLCHSCLTGGKHYRLSKQEKIAIIGTKDCLKTVSRMGQKADELEAIFMQT